MSPSASPRAPGVRSNPPRLWTAEEASARIADLEELLPRLRGWVLRLREVHEELHRLAEFWAADVDAPDHADHALKQRLDAEWQNLTRRLEEAVGGLRKDGIEVKDLEQGTVDFYGLEAGEVVFLCWQRGEPRVAFFHPISGSFRNRRPIGDAARRASPSPRGSAARGAP
ncbi:MAG TPA: DUF2203 domain-containing protein [Thermoplasmata archaeon]|nr:DUF2203 domain-containing protein [Thermoplasmata archaeon]